MPNDVSVAALAPVWVKHLDAATKVKSLALAATTR